MRGREEKIRLAYLVTHPIQYQAPLLRRLSREPGIELTVFFGSDFSTRSFFDPDFAGTIAWDTPLLHGYRYEVLPAWGRKDRLSFWRPFNYGLARRLRKGKFHVLWVSGYARWFHLVSMVSAKFLGLKVLVRDEATLISKPRHLLNQVLKRGFFFLLDKLCDGFLAIGTLNRQYYQSNGIKDEKLFLLPYAVDNAFFQEKTRRAAERRDELRRHLGLTEDWPVILFAGKLMERKRAADLWEAYRRLSPDGVAPPPAYLLLVGDGDRRRALQQQAKQTGWQTVKFPGFINQQELPRYYDLCDVFVLPSVYEPWGLVVNEAMNAGRPVIVSDQVGCAPDLLKPGVNGWIFRGGDPESLHQVLKEALAHRNALRAMGQQSLRLINNWGFEEDVRGLKQALETVFLSC
jgi:glycosyltransferase involved in cell wall biosynthesis